MSVDPRAAAGRPRSDLRRIAGLLAGLAIIGFLGWSIVDGWSTITEYDWSPEPLPLIAGFAVLLLFYAMSGAGFAAILEALGPTPGWATTIRIWAVSLLGRYVPGNVLMVVGRVVLLHDHGVSRRVSLAATVYEQALALAAGAAGGVVYLAVAGGGAATWLVALIPLGLVLLHPRLFGPISAWALRLARRDPLPVLIGGRRVAALAGWYLVTAAVSALGIWLCVRGVAGAGVGDPVEVGSAFLLSFALSMVAFVFPSGLGVREGVFAVALARELPGSVAVAVSVGARLALTVAELVFIGIALLVERLR